MGVHHFAHWDAKDSEVYIVTEASCSSVQYLARVGNKEEGMAFSENFPVPVSWSEPTSQYPGRIPQVGTGPHCFLICCWLPLSYEFISPPDYGPKLALRFDNGSHSLVILPLSTLDSQTALTTAIPDNIPAHSTKTVASARAIRIQGRVAESFFFF